jgi:heavy metal efflux system protein
MLKGANSAEVVSRVKAKMETIQKSMPEDVVIEPFLDRTDLVKRAIATVEKNLIEGALIVIFVLVVFLGNLRAGLIVASAIPLSMLFALGMMNVFGVSANLMSLGAIDFGLIVDGAVIIVEATMHHLGLRNAGPKLTQAEMDEEVYQSASKIRNSAAFGEIIILVVYIPILTLTGIEGKMFTPMAQTVGFAILGALILSLTYIPMMSALFLSKKISHEPTFSDRMMAFFQRLYAPVLAIAIRFKYAVVAATVALFALTVWLFGRLGGEFIPQLQEGDYAFHCILPMGSSLSQSMETSMQSMRIIKSFPEVKMVVGKTGSAEVPTDPMPPEATDMMIILKDKSEWVTTDDYNELAKLMMEKLEAIPGIVFEANQPIQMRFNELMTGIRQDVAVKVFGENIDTLAAYAPAVAQVIQSVGGTTAPQVERTTGLPQITIEYDRNRLANYGVSIEDVNHTVSTAFAGEKAGVVFENERKFDLVVRLDSAHRASIEDVSELYVPTPNGSQIPLSQVATVAFKQGPAQISRDDGKRRIVIGFNVQGRDVQTVVKEIREKLDSQVKLPPGYYFTFGGTFENLEKANARLRIAVPVALALIFMLLYFTFNSFGHALLIYTAIPMSAIGGVFALLIRGMPFSISAGVGFIALFGVAVLNGIVLIATFNQLKNEGVDDVFKRVKEGTKIRLRPVLMTASVAALGFLPMALSTGAGAEVQKPLATVVIGGLITATFLTLVVLPLLYIIFKKGGRSQQNGKGVVAGAVLAFLLFFNQNTSAQTPLTLDEAVAQAKANNLQIKAGIFEVQAQEALRGAAYELPKTAFDLQMGQYNSNRFDQSVGIRQDIPNPRNKRAGLALNDANTRSAQLSLSVTEERLAYEVRSVWYELAFLLEKQRLLQTQDSLLGQFVQAAELRLRAGETSSLERTTAVSQSAEVKNQLAWVQADIAIAQSRLQTLLATSEPVSIPPGSRLEQRTFLLAGDASANPVLAWYRQQVAVSEAKAEVEKAKLMPDFSVGYLNQSLTTPGGSTPDYSYADRFHVVQAGISVPIFGKAQKSRIEAAQLERQVVQASAEAQSAILDGEVRRAEQEYEKQLQTLAYYEQTALPTASLLLSTAQTAFRAGSIDYVEYVQALTRAHNIRLGHLEALNQYNQAVVRYQFFVKQ